jgi:hypothetical protein
MDYRRVKLACGLLGGVLGFVVLGLAAAIIGAVAAQRRVPVQV